MAKKKSKKWVQGAIKRPGALKEYAAKHGGLDKGGDISSSWAEGLAKRLRGKKKKTAAETRLLKQVNLFFTLRGMKK